ncbi:MAG: flagellar brake protein [Candidatus Caldatribacteriaceae bacterium]
MHMERNQIFKVNRRLSVGVKKKSEDGQEQTVFYGSRIEMVRQDELWIAALQEKGVLVPVNVGEKLEIYLMGENEVFYFQCVVKNRLRKGNIAYLVLQVPQEVVRKQRREYVRFNVVLPVFLKKGEKTLAATTKNVSGGGMLVHLDERKETLKLQEEVFFSLHMNGGEIMGKAEVVRKEDPHLYGFRFTVISDRDREEIIRYIFKQQVELRKKGLLKR